MKKIQNGIVINKGAADEKSSVEKDNVAGTEADSASKTAETTTVTAKAGAATVTTTNAARPADEKSADVAVRKEGDKLTITAGAGGNGGDAIVTVNTGAVDIKA